MIKRILTNVINFFKGVPNFVEKRPFVSVFASCGFIIGSLFLTVFIADTRLESDQGQLGHWYIRSLIHLGWGSLLAKSAFFGLIQLDNNIKYNFGYKQMFGLPVLIVMIIALNQEFGFPGDFRVNWSNGEYLKALKSFQDITTWTISSVFSIWSLYRNCDVAYACKLEYLSKKRKLTGEL